LRRSPSRRPASSTLCRRCAGPPATRVCPGHSVATEYPLYAIGPDGVAFCYIAETEEAVSIYQVVSRGFLEDAALAALLPTCEELCRAVNFACLAKSLREDRAEHERLARAREAYETILAAAAAAELPPSDRD